MRERKITEQSVDDITRVLEQYFPLVFGILIEEGDAHSSKTKEVSHQLADAINAIYFISRNEERERCARLCETGDIFEAVLGDDWKPIEGDAEGHVRLFCAAAIRQGL